jgi:plasmid stability protein
MAQVIVKGLDESVLERLKARAKQHGHTLQSELKTIIEQAAQQDFASARKLAAQLRRKLAGRTHTDSAELVSEDRSR